MTSPPTSWTTATLPDRLAALERSLSLAGDRLSAAEAAPARSLLERAQARLGRSAVHTVVALAGGTGSGKSSLFNALVGVPLSAVGVRRPLTQEVIACVWGEAGPADPAAAGLLDWLGVSPAARLSRTSSLDPGPDPELAGLILLDLPDHDTVRTQQISVVDRVVEHADLVIWVVDPQKYADAALHERYLGQLGGRDAALAVVMNQLDRIEASTASTLGADLRRLLQEDGLGDAAVLAASAVTGGGLPGLRSLVVERVSARRAAVVRLETELSGVAGDLRTLIGAEPRPPTEQQSNELTAAVIAACAGNALTEQLLVEGRLREPVVVSENHVERAVTRLVDSVFAPLPTHWLSFAERLVDPHSVSVAVAAAVGGLDVSRVGPSGLRRIFMRREQVERLRRDGVRAAVWQAVAGVLAETVGRPIADEIAVWAPIARAVDASR